MVGRRTVAVATSMVVVLLLMAGVMGNYTVCKDEVTHQYKEHVEESVENTKEGAKLWVC